MRSHIVQAGFRLGCVTSDDFEPDCVVLGIKSRVSCILGKHYQLNHITNPRQVFLLYL